jgi:galactokinase
VDLVSVWTARAPGRLDVMGGIADYSGALVLQWPIRESTTVAIELQPSQVLRVVSKNASGSERVVEVPLSFVNGAMPPYGELHEWFVADRTRHWAAYVVGVFAVLAGQLGIRYAQGASIEVTSDVPEGKGVSSSAALEAATMTALVAALAEAGVARDMLEPLDAQRTRALLCQRAENFVVGAPCGVMDQMAAICGRAGHLMALLCQPAELRPPVHLPEELAVFGVDSGIRHAVTGSDYTAVRVGAFMGYRILADMAGLRVSAGAREGHVVIDDPRWHGYLANVGSGAFQEYEPHLPNTLGGSTFLGRYGGTTDLVTTVHPDRCYPVWTPTAHPVYEHERVLEWAATLAGVEQAPDPGAGTSELTRGDRASREQRVHEVAVRLGALMLQSHASYSACGLGSDGTDLLVHLAKAAGIDRGIYGAKITGGGSGGTVAILARADAVESVRAIASKYAEESGREPYLFEGSSDGAALTGARLRDDI